MDCPKCKKETNVKDSRKYGPIVRRRRRCPSCNHKFSTVEQVAEAPPKRKTPAPVKKKERKRALKPRIKAQQNMWENVDHLSDDELEAMIYGEDYD
jgi:transcriptional regulator NrdR family protein